MRTPEPDPAPKPASAAGHALALFVLAVVCESQWASATNAAEVLQLCEHVEIIQQLRQGNDLEITHAREVEYEAGVVNWTKGA